jgi:hypothetical protein
MRGASYLDVLALITATVAAYLAGFFLNRYRTLRPGARATSV